MTDVNNTKTFRECVAESNDYTVKSSDVLGINATVKGKKVGKTKDGHHIIAASETIHSRTNNRQLHATYVAHHETGRIMATHHAKDEAGQKAAVKHAKTTDRFWSDSKDAAKNWSSEHDGKGSFISKKTD